MTAVTCTTLPFWLLLLLLASVSTQPPPDGILPTPGPILNECVRSCECYPERQARPTPAAPLAVTVECSDADDLPPIFPAWTTLLRVTDSRVPTLRTQLHHAHLAKLRDLDLARNGIREVAVDAFRRLPKLKQIDLSYNAIDALSAQHFVHQRNLKLLIVTGNPSLDCVALRRELPSVCVKCDADDAPCERTTRGTTSAAVERSPRPETGPEPSGIAPAGTVPGPDDRRPDTDPSAPDDSTASVPPVTQGSSSAWFWIGIAASFGVIVGAVLLAATVKLAPSVFGCKGMMTPLKGGDNESKSPLSGRGRQGASGGR